MTPYVRGEPVIYLDGKPVRWLAEWRDDVNECHENCGECQRHKIVIQGNLFTGYQSDLAPATPGSKIKP